MEYKGVAQNLTTAVFDSLKGLAYAVFTQIWQEEEGKLQMCHQFAY